MDKIVYCAIVINGKIVAGHYKIPELLFIMDKFIPSIDYTMGHKRSFAPSRRTVDSAIQYMVQDSVVYITASKNDYPARGCFKLIDELEAEFKKHVCKNGLNFETAICQPIEDRQLLEAKIRELVDHYSKDELYNKDNVLIYTQPYIAPYSKQNNSEFEEKTLLKYPENIKPKTKIEKGIDFFSDLKNRVILILILLLTVSLIAILMFYLNQ